MTAEQTAEPSPASTASRAARSPDPDRNLALELVRATEAAAIACSGTWGSVTRNRSTRLPWTPCGPSWAPCG